MGKKNKLNKSTYFIFLLKKFFIFIKISFSLYIPSFKFFQNFIDLNKRHKFYFNFNEKNQKFILYFF
jgi:hypothetical protein